MRGSDDHRRSHTGPCARRIRRWSRPVRAADGGSPRERRPDPRGCAAARRDGGRARAEPAPAGSAGHLRRGLRRPPGARQPGTDMVRDAVTGRASSQLLPRFDTISYRELWSDVAAVAAAWSQAAEARSARGLRRDDRVRQRRLPRRRSRLRLPGPGRRAVAAQRPRVPPAADPRRDAACCAGGQRGLPRPRRRVGARERLAAAARRIRLHTGGRRRPRTRRARQGETRRRGHGGRRRDARGRRRARACPAGSPELHRRRPGSARDDPLHVGQHGRPQGRHVDREDGRHAVDLPIKPPTCPS